MRPLGFCGERMPASAQPSCVVRTLNRIEISPSAIVDEDRCTAGDYIVRVGYARPARSVTYVVAAFDLGLLRPGTRDLLRILDADGNGDGNLGRRAQMTGHGGAGLSTPVGPC